MFGALLYIGLLLPNDSLKQAHNASSLVAPVSQTYSFYDTVNYSKVDSASLAKLPSTARIQNTFPVPADFMIMPERQNKTPGFIAVLLLLSFITVSLVRAGYPKEFSELFSVLRSVSVTQQIYRVQTNSLNMPLAILTINAVLSFSLSVYFIVHFKGYSLHYSGASLFFIISAIVSLLFIYRLGSGLFTGILFPVKKEMSFYSFCTLQILRISGIALLPLNILLAFGNSSWQSVVVAMCLAAVLLSIGLVYVRGFMITKDLFRENKFHFLLYICTLEIAPAMAIIKFLMIWIKKN